MSKLNINIEKNGKMIPVGVIEGDSRDDASFRYHNDYLEDS